jgi:hypothetical protein
MKRTENYMSAADKSFRIKFGKHIANKFDVTTKRIKYLCNSVNYPDSVALTATDLISGDMFGVIRKDKTGAIVDTYVLSVNELNSVMNLYHTNTRNLVTSRNQNPDERGVLVRIPYSYLETYKEAV